MLIHYLGNGKVATSVSESQLTPRYGILVDTERRKVVVSSFIHYQEILELILSSDCPKLIFYRSQYTKPTIEEIDELSEMMFLRR